MSFATKYPIEDRLKESGRIREKHPDRVPVIVERKKECKSLMDMDKNKYLVPGDMTVGQFVYVIRRRVKITSEKAMFVFINNTLPPTSALMSRMYTDHADPDGFLYMTYAGENTFGG